MSAKKTEVKATKTSMEKVYEELNARLTTLEKLVAQLAYQKPKARKVRDYTEEQRAAIRARLLAGQEAARKKHEAEVKATVKPKVTKLETVKTTQTEKPTKA